MRVCLLCAGPMPDPVRDDALYCSTSCKLKAQRKRKKERAARSADSSDTATTALVAQDSISTPLDGPLQIDEGPQLSLPFMRARRREGRQLGFWFIGAAPEVKEEPSPKPQETPPTPIEIPVPPKPKGWAAKLFAKLKGEAAEQQEPTEKAKPSQLSEDDRLDIV